MKKIVQFLQTCLMDKFFWECSIGAFLGGLSALLFAKYMLGMNL